MYWNTSIVFFYLVGVSYGLLWKKLISFTPYWWVVDIGFIYLKVYSIGICFLSIFLDILMPKLDRLLDAIGVFANNFIPWYFIFWKSNYLEPFTVV